MSIPAVVKSFIFSIVVVALSACGGGGSSDSDTTTTTTTTTSSRDVGGGGVKGPLANAIVTVYAFDSAQPGFKGAVVATATTNASAAITGLALPFPVTPPYILEFTSDGGTTDITTGQAPVITTMRTVITQSLLDAGEQIYATPVTTMAVDIAIANAVDTNGTAGIQADEFETALAAAAAQVVSTLGFGMDSSIDIFDTPPLVDSTTDSAAEQAAVAAYRTAVEAVTAIAYQIDQQTAGGNTDSVLAELSADLADGGGIDGSAGTEINVNTLQVFQQDPATLLIPGTTQTVGDVQAILVAEKATTGSTTPTTELDSGGSITTVTKPAETNPDKDGDGTLNADDAFPDDFNEDTDTDGDGIGDNADPDDNNNGILDVDEGQTPTPVANDADQDGVEDSSDNCPAVFNPSQTNTDALGDGGDACDSDDDEDGTPDVSDAFPLDSSEQIDTDRDGLGNNVVDNDDDNDGVADTADLGVAPVGAPSAGVACSLLRDCDGDGVFDGSDFDPVDPAVTSNFAPVANDDSATVDEDASTFSIAVIANDSDNDGNPNDSVSLTAIGSNDTALGAAVINGNSIDYTPAADASGTDTFTYTVTDGSVTSTASVTVTVNPVNDAPAITQTGSLAVMMDEDGVPTAFAAPTIDATDAEGDSLTWTLGTDATNGTATVSGTGASPTITYVPNQNYSGSDSFDVSVSDGALNALITINVTVDPVNDAPVANADADSTDEDTAFTTINVLSNDTDGGDGPGALSVTAVDATSANGGSVVDNTDGTFGYTPAADFNGDDTFSYTVSDGSSTAVGTVTITVNPVNDAPVANADADSTDEDTAFTTINVLSNDTDGGDGPGALSVTAVDATSANGGSVVDNTDGTFGYTPAADFNGDDTFTYTVSDGSSTAVGTVTVTVNPVNDAPVANADADSTDEDTAFTTINVLSNDTDGGDGPGALSVTAVDATSANGGSVVDNTDGTFGYTPAADFNGDDTFTYTVSDGSSTAVGTVTITVNPVNDAPVANADADSTDEDTAFTTINVLSNDTDGGDGPGALSVTAVDATSANGGSVVDNTDGTFGYTPAADFNGDDTFSYTVSDGSSTAVGTVTVTVNPVNDAPVANADADSTDEDTAFTTINVLSNDTDGGDGPGALSVTAVDATSANGGSVVDNTDGTFGYTPAADFNGDDTFSYTVSDGSSTAVGTVTVTVNPINDAPVGNADAASAAVLTATVVDVLANDTDVDGDTLTITGVTNGSLGSSVEISGGGSTVTFTDVNNSGATETFSYDVFDGTTTVSGIVVTMTVTVNAPPVANADSTTTDEDIPVTTGDVLSNDSDGGDGNALSITAFDATSANGGSVVDNTDGTFDYTPAADFNGDDTFTYTISDTFSTAVGTVTIMVNPVNDDPVANADADSTDEDTAFTTINVLSNDTDGGDGPGALSVTAFDATSANGGSVLDNTDGTFGYTPAADFNGDDTFSYTVSDGSSTAVGTVTITVNPVNDAPVAVDDVDSVAVNGLVVIADVLGNDSDPDGDNLTVAAGNPTAANGIVTNNGDGSFDYVPNPDYVGTDSFDYTVEDGNGGSDVGTVTITVNPPGAVATVADLLAESQGGGVGAIESWNGTLSEFEYWRDIIFDATPGTLSFIDKAYDYDTQAFVDVGGFDSYWLTSGGTWELPSGVDVVTPNDGDGSMVVAVRNAGDTENVAEIRIRAFTQDIAGELISDYLDANWSAQMLNAGATFGPGAQLVTSYSFEDLTDSYSFELEDWCEFEDPTRYAALGNSCNGVFINSTGSYAISLAELQVSTAWTDTETTDDSGLDSVSLSYDDSTNSELLAELVIAGSVVNFYVRDYDLTGADYIVKLAETSTWVVDDVPGVFMIRFTVPAALQSQFPELGDEGGLNPIFAEFGGFVRGGVYNQTGNITADANIFNGIALDEVLANFDAPVAPDLTDLIGTWVSDSTSFTNGDPTVFHYFASTHYEVSGTCDDDGSIGLEYGTMNVNAADGTFSTSTFVDGRGSCSLASAAGMGATLTVNGDTLTLDVSGQLTTFSRLRGEPSPLVGSWVAGDIAVGGDGGHVLLTFFGDGSYMHSEDCSVDGIGTEYGFYSWDDGGTNQVTTSQVYDANGGDPGCGLSENSAGDWELSVVGDTLTVTVPLEGSFDFTRHSPAVVPITPPIAFVEGNLPNSTAYNVEYDADTDSWLNFQVDFGNAGEFTVTQLPGGTPDVGSYAVFNGVLETTDSGGGVGYAMIMSLDTASGAQRLCLTDTYAELDGCAQPGETFLFDNQTDAENFVTARETGGSFTGSAVDASTVFGASAISMLELDSYYDGELDAEVDELTFFELTADGTNATDIEYALNNGNWVLLTDNFDIALTSTGWKANVDWRFDTSAFSGSNVTLSNVEAGETLQSLTATFSEMALVGEPIFDYIDSALAVGLVNGTFGSGAKIYETTVTFNTDYFYINDWGADCDDGSGGNYNGNCNVAQLRTLNRVTGDLAGFDAALDTSFVGDNTATIELGWRPDGSLLGVFLGDGTIELWEVDWNGTGQAVMSGFPGSWTQDDGLTGSGEILIYYEVPAELQNSYDVQGADSPAVFLSQQNGYVRFGELEDAAGPLGEPVYFFNRSALEDINANIPGTPVLPSP